MHIVIVGYVDPGMGLLAWQAVVAVFLGVLFYVRKTRNWVAGLLRRTFRLGKTAEPAAAQLKTPENSVPR